MSKKCIFITIVKTVCNVGNWAIRVARNKMLKWLGYKENPEGGLKIQTGCCGNRKGRERRFLNGRGRSRFGIPRVGCFMSKPLGLFQILKLFAKLCGYVHFFQGEVSRAFIRFSQFSLKVLWITEQEGDTVSKIQHILSVE